MICPSFINLLDQVDHEQLVDEGILLAIATFPGGFLTEIAIDTA
jgi:hypothetical protein